MGLKRPGSGQLDEAGERYRDSGQCDLGKYDGTPHCHKLAVDLPAETTRRHIALPTEGVATATAPTRFSKCCKPHEVDAPGRSGVLDTHPRNTT